MELKIVIDINLTDEEVSFLRKYFENKERSLHILHLYLPQNGIRNVAIELIQKDILKIDSISNMTLTNIGKKVMDMIDRDKRIHDILS
jgi:hypothetical protein